MRMDVVTSWIDECPGVQNVCTIVFTQGCFFYIKIFNDKHTL